MDTYPRFAHAGKGVVVASRNMQYVVIDVVCWGGTELCSLEGLNGRFAVSRFRHVDSKKGGAGRDALKAALREDASTAA